MKVIKKQYVAPSVVIVPAKLEPIMYEPSDNWAEGKDNNFATDNGEDNGSTGGDNAFGGNSPWGD